MTRRNFLKLAALGVPLDASAQSAWPERPVRLIVPFPVGGATDLVARSLSQRLSLNLGQTVLVENRPGAGGTTGSAELLRAAPDGQVLLLATSSTHAVAPHLNPRLPYDPRQDFTPIAHIADNASILLVSPRLPVRTVGELIAHARAHPGKLNYGSSGNGTVVHLTTEAFKAQAGIFMTHIPYRGTAAAIPDLVEGNIDVLFDSIASGIRHVQEGRLRALAVTDRRRSALAPEVPTLAESGLPGFVSVTWFGLYGPRGMADGLRRRIHDEFARALRAPEVQQRLAQLGAEPAAQESSEQFAAMVARDSEAWGRLIRERRISAE